MNYKDRVEHTGLAWQPIETAPKDGTKILVFWKAADNHQGRVDISFWKDRIWASDLNLKNISFPATHWMPLPEAPQ